MVATRWKQKIKTSVKYNCTENVILLVSLGFINLIYFNSYLLNEDGGNCHTADDLQSLYKLLCFYFLPISKIHSVNQRQPLSTQQAVSRSNSKQI